MEFYHFLGGWHCCLTCGGNAMYELIAQPEVGLQFTKSFLILVPFPVEVLFSIITILYDHPACNKKDIDIYFEILNRLYLWRVKFCQTILLPSARWIVFIIQIIVFDSCLDLDKLWNEVCWQWMIQKSEHSISILCFIAETKL